MGNRLFRDQRYPDEIITEDALRREFCEKLLENEELNSVTFEQYIFNCMESQGGTLSRMVPEPEKQACFTFLLRETLETRVTVEASDAESALDEVTRRYENGEYDLDRNCFAGSEIRPCCSCCGSDFDCEDNDLREIEAKTEHAKLLCDRCVEDMENNGRLTRCESCTELFTPSRLRTNPSNGVQELCPYCGEVWCE